MITLFNDTFNSVYIKIYNEKASIDEDIIDSNCRKKFDVREGDLIKIELHGEYDPYGPYAYLLSKKLTQKEYREIYLFISPIFKAISIQDDSLVTIKRHSYAFDNYNFHYKYFDLESNDSKFLLNNCEFLNKDELLKKRKKDLWLNFFLSVGDKDFGTAFFDYLEIKKLCLEENAIKKLSEIISENSIKEDVIDRNTNNSVT